MNRLQERAERDRRFVAWLLLFAALVLAAARSWLQHAAGGRAVSWNQLLGLLDVALLMSFYWVADGAARAQRMRWARHERARRRGLLP
jgi:hypothetical protein